MSLNLAFVTKEGGYNINFPFQTPTDLSNAVYRAKSTKRRLKLIKAYLDKYDNVPYDLLGACEKMFNDKTLELEIV